MIPALARFVEALRREGVRVSQAEVLDAARALEAVGLERRERFRLALRSTLAKGRRQCEIFDPVFDAFFAPPARGGKGRRGERGGVGGPGDRGSRGTAPGHRIVPERPAVRGRRRDGDADRERRRIEAALQAATRRGPDRVGRLRLAAVRSDGRRGPGRSVPPRDPRREGLRRNLAQPMLTETERALAEQVPRLIESLRLRVARRLKRARRGRLWVRQLFRENLSRGGVPFVIPLRRPRRRRSRVVLLVDVSYSVARAAGYFLWMASAFLRPGRDVRVVAFVDRPVEATRALRGWMRGSLRPPTTTPGEGPRAAGRPRGRARPGAGIRPSGLAFTDLLDSLEEVNLSAPSDYGRTFHALMGPPWRPRGRDTVLLVLGDARTNRFDPLPWTLEELSGLYRGVIWLVPEPRERWGTGDSALADYLPHVDALVEAWDLEGLSHGLTELLRRV